MESVLAVAVFVPGLMLMAYDLWRDGEMLMEPGFPDVGGDLFFGLIALMIWLPLAILFVALYPVAWVIREQLNKPDRRRWAQEASARDQEDPPGRAERQLQLAKQATENATCEGTVPFGSPVSLTEVEVVEAFLNRHARRGILRYLDCSERTLRAFARSEIDYPTLPHVTKVRLHSLAGLYAKGWARKSAAIAYAIEMERAAERERASSHLAEQMVEA